MKKEFKDIQDHIDIAVWGLIESGVREHSHLKQEVRTVIKDSLTITGEITIPYLLEVIAGIEASSSKQRLREQGLVEIAKGNQAIPVNELSPDDAEDIAVRRSAEIKGRLEALVLFCHKHGQIGQAHEAASQLALFSREEVEQSVLEDSMKGTP